MGVGEGWRLQMCPNIWKRQLLTSCKIISGMVLDLTGFAPKRGDIFFIKKDDFLLSH